MVIFRSERPCTKCTEMQALLSLLNLTGTTKIKIVLLNQPGYHISTYNCRAEFLLITRGEIKFSSKLFPIEMFCTEIKLSRRIRGTSTNSTEWTIWRCTNILLTCSMSMRRNDGPLVILSCILKELFMMMTTDPKGAYLTVIMVWWHIVNTIS